MGTNHGFHRETNLDLRILRSLVARGVFRWRLVATISRSAGSRWNVGGSLFISETIAGMTGWIRTVAGEAAIASHSSIGTSIANRPRSTNVANSHKLMSHRIGRSSGGSESRACRSAAL